MRGLIWIEAIACTVPTASTTIGIGFLPTVVDHDGHRARRDWPARADPAAAPMAAGLADAFSAALAAAPKPSLLGHLVAINIGRPADRNRDHSENRHTGPSASQTLQSPKPQREL